jgi:S-adenosylmethionine synthetase
VLIDTGGTGRISETVLSNLVREHFSLNPHGIIETLKLRQPIYRKTAAYGHFGRNEDGFNWELTDRAQGLREAAKI